MSNPNKYRKKPVTVEARRWDGTAGGATPIIGWVLASGERSARYAESQPETRLHGKVIREAVPALLAIDTLEGTMHAIAGDWIIKGTEGEFYPCKPAAFAATFECADHVTGAHRIAVERARQVSEEGYDAEHDAGHAPALINAATAYAIESRVVIEEGVTPDVLTAIPGWWPWSSHHWKPTGDPVRDLTKAGALIAAAIDSLLAAPDVDISVHLPREES